MTHLRATRSAFLLLPALFAALATTSEGRAADPGAAECLAANESSIKLRTQHELRAARTQLLVCAAATCPVDIRAECARRVDEINRALPSLVFEAKGPDGGDLASVKVTMDGKTLVDRLDGSAVVVDPGEHKFLFETQNQKPVEKVLVVREGERARHERVGFGAPTARPDAPAAGVSSSVASTASAGGGSQRTIGLVTAGVGVAALATGAVFGLLANSAKNDYQSHCGAAIGAPQPSDCDPTGVSGHDDATKKATLSTIFFVGGGVATAAGVVLFLTGSKGGASTQVGVAPGRLYVEGHF
jgi:hypothetical protein